MKFALASDVHLEFGDLDITNQPDADVLLLAGDICVADDLKKTDRGAMFYDFFDRCSKKYNKVLYIAGNHEYYHGEFFKTQKTLALMAFEFSNLHYLEGDMINIGDTTIIGGTLWTNFNKEDPMTMLMGQESMNDYVHIKRRTQKPDSDMIRTLSPIDILNVHKNTMDLFGQMVGGMQKVVVMSHHAPTKASTHPRYKDVHINGCYSSDLSDFILDNPNIKVWVHGHTHHKFDYMVGTTRVIANPRGYVDYERDEDINPYFFETFEV